MSIYITNDYYSSDSPGYRVLDITSKSIIMVLDTYFNESALGSLDNQIEGEQHIQHQFNNGDLMDEYNNETMQDNNSENEKINEDKIN
ncbi:hypothetical protein U3516DRAFT_760123 [Neocallimastix sp. 'constans']